MFSRCQFSFTLLITGISPKNILQRSSEIVSVSETDFFNNFSVLPWPSRLCTLCLIQLLYKSMCVRSVTPRTLYFVLYTRPESIIGRPACLPRCAACRTRCPFSFPIFHTRQCRQLKVCYSQVAGESPRYPSCSPGCWLFSIIIIL